MRPTTAGVCCHPLKSAIYECTIYDAIVVLTPVMLDFETCLGLESDFPGLGLVTKGFANIRQKKSWILILKIPWPSSRHEWDMESSASCVSSLYLMIGLRQIQNYRSNLHNVKHSTDNYIPTSPSSLCLGTVICVFVSISRRFLVSPFLPIIYLWNACGICHVSLNPFAVVSMSASKSMVHDSSAYSSISERTIT